VGKASMLAVTDVWGTALRVGGMEKLLQHAKIVTTTYGRQGLCSKPCKNLLLFC
jgi:hypothetical protein